MRAEDLDDGDERLAQDWNSATNIQAWAAGVDKEDPKAIVEKSETLPEASGSALPKPVEDDSKTVESEQKKQTQKPSEFT